MLDLLVNDGDERQHFKEYLKKDENGAVEFVDNLVKEAAAALGGLAVDVVVLVVAPASPYVTYVT